MKNIVYCVIDYVVSLSEEFTAQLISLFVIVWKYLKNLRFKRKIYIRIHFACI